MLKVNIVITRNSQSSQQNNNQKMTINNLFRCSLCNSLLNDEEKENHNCYDDKILFDTNGTFSLNGKKWYRWYDFSPYNQHPNGTPRYSTEPKLDDGIVNHVI